MRLMLKGARLNINLIARLSAERGKGLALSKFHFILADGDIIVAKEIVTE